MSIERLRGEIGEIEALVEQGLADVRAAAEPIDSAVAGLGVLLKSSARLEAEAAQGTLREAAERLVSALDAGRAALEAAAQYKAGL